MAGILNKKERMIDFLITKQGRRQMSSGRMRVEFATITDSHTFYEASGSNNEDIATDASDRLFFEACERPQDLIVPELQSGYSMQPFSPGDFSISGRKIASGTFKSGVMTNKNVLSGSTITDELPQRLMTSLSTNFREQRILGTEDVFSDTSEFALTAHTASFVLTDENLDFPIGRRRPLDNIPNIFNNQRFSHLPNFRYMPPINASLDEDGNTVPLGNYPNLQVDRPVRTRGQLENLLGPKQSLEFGFRDTSRDNNIIAQVFEFSDSDSSVEKLSIVDFGEFSDNDPESPGSHVYYIGKIRQDSRGCQTFINLFTVVFD